MSHRIGLRYTAKFGRKAPKDPPAFNYDDIIGAIWLPEPKGSYGGTYDTAPTGEIEVREPSGEDAQTQPQGGFYDTR